MSLVALVLRIATVRALRGRTFAGGMVFDSKLIAPHVDAIENEAPIVIVSTDDDEIKIEGRDLWDGQHQLDLVIEVAIASQLTVKGDDGENQKVLTVSNTSAGLEASLGILGWQITQALAMGGGPWGEIWRRLVPKVNNVFSRRGADITNGVAYAARQIVYVVDPLCEPVPGLTLGDGDIWTDILALMRTDGELSDIADIIEHQITGGDYQPWEIVRGSLGIAEDAAELVGITPIKINEAVALESIDLSDGLIIDPAVASQADPTKDGGDE